MADLLCGFIDADDLLIDHHLNDRVISASPEMLSVARRIVLASGGWEKSTAILAAIRLLKPQVLITDETVAETLVDG